MNKINWFKRSDNPKDLLCVGERFGYACSNTGLAMSYMLILGFLSFYYTDVVGISAGVVGTIMLVSRVFDGVTDLVMGWLMDRTHTRWGKARPWLFAVAIPHAVACILAFAVPAGAAEMQKYIYIFVTYNLLNAVTYTMCSVPVYAGNCLLTDSQEEHAKSGIWMQIGAAVSLLIVQYTCVSMVTKLGGDFRAWTLAVAFYSVIGAVLMMFSAVTIRERIEIKPEEKSIPFRKRIKAIFSNKYWVLYTLVWLLMTVMEQGTGAGGMYYAAHVLGDESTYAIFSSVQTMGQLVILLAAMTFVVRKLGNVGCTVWSFVFTGIACLIQMFTVNWGVILFCSVLKGLAYAFFLGAQGGMMADAINYGSKKAGFDNSGIGNAGITFGSKCGAGLGMALVGWILEFSGYDGTAAVQTAGGIMGVKIIFLIMPIVISVISILLLIPYDLYKKVKRGEAVI